jgi:glycosyltransferase involved in cell wall biosynthesis
LVCNITRDLRILSALLGQFMRILNVLFEERFGGPQNEVLQVTPGLTAKAIETLVAVPLGEPLFAQRMRKSGINFVELSLVRPRHSLNPLPNLQFFGRFWPNVLTLRRLIKRHRIDLVHTNGFLYLQAALAARLARVPLVWCLNDVYTPAPFRIALLPFVQKLSTRVRAVSRAVAQYYFPRNPSLDGRLDVVYPPVDVNAFHLQTNGSLVRQELGVPQGVPLIGSVGNLDPGKGFEFLLQAAPRILTHYPDARFIIIGAKLANRGNYFKMLTSLVDNLSLQDSVKFLGYRSDIPRLMSAMNIYLHPSEFESVAMAVLEASAAGRPVVACSVGGVPEVVQNGVTGILVKKRDPEAIAETVLGMLRDPGAACDMGREGARRMREYFSLEQCVNGHVRIYEAALDRR